MCKTVLQAGVLFLKEPSDHLLVLHSKSSSDPIDVDQDASTLMHPILYEIEPHIPQMFCSRLQMLLQTDLHRWRVRANGRCDRITKTQSNQEREGHSDEPLCAESTLVVGKKSSTMPIQ